jgi:hypothetical protein
MKKYLALTCYTLVANLLIIVGAGHGIAPLGLLEIAGFRFFYELGTANFSWSLLADYDGSLDAAALFSLAGQLLLAGSFFIKTKKHSTTLIITGLALLWMGFLYLAHNVFNSHAAVVSFTTGIPFLLISGILLYRILKDRKTAGPHT